MVREGWAAKSDGNDVVDRVPDHNAANSATVSAQRFKRQMDSAKAQPSYCVVRPVSHGSHPDFDALLEVQSNLCGAPAFSTVELFYTNSGRHFFWQGQIFFGPSVWTQNLWTQPALLWPLFPLINLDRSGVTGKGRQPRRPKAVRLSPA